MVFVKAYRKDSKEIEPGLILEDGVNHVEEYGCITSYSTGGWVTITIFLEVVWMDDGTPVLHPISPRYTIKARRDKHYLGKNEIGYWPSSYNRFYLELTYFKIHPEYDDDIVEKLWNQDKPYLNA